MSNNIETLTTKHEYLIRLLTKELEYSLENAKTFKELKSYMEPDKFEVLYHNSEDHLCCPSNLTMLYLTKLLIKSLPIEIESLNILHDVLILRFKDNYKKTRMGFINGTKISFEMSDNEITGDEKGNRFLKPDFIKELLISLETVISIFKDLENLREINNAITIG